jgi:chromosome segregation ATPase
MSGTNSYSTLKKAYEELETLYRQAKKDLEQTIQSNRENSSKYVDILNRLNHQVEELHNTRKTLEDMLKAKTAELLMSNERLDQAQEKIKRLEKELGS